MLSLGLRVFVNPIVGGALIGLAASVLFLFNGRIAGVSGILNRVLEESWRAAFITGLVVGGAAVFYFGGGHGHNQFSDDTGIGLLQTIIAGGLVGFGTALGSGCTSGHGVCGISRFSKRSIAATVLFIFAGFVTVTVMVKVLR